MMKNKYTSKNIRDNIPVKNKMGVKTNKSGCI